MIPEKKCIHLKINACNKYKDFFGHNIIFSFFRGTDITLGPNKNISAVRVTCQKKLGRVGRENFFFQEFFFILKNVYQFSQVTIFSPVTHLSAVLN